MIKTRAQAARSIALVPVFRFLALLLPLAFIGFGGEILTARLQQAFPPDLALIFAVAGASATISATILAYRALVAILEARPVDELTRKGAISALAEGVVLGVLLCSLAILSIWWLSGGINDGFGSLRDVVLQAFGAASAATVEEILFRGVLFRLIERSAGTRWGLAVSAMLFGLVHAANPDASLTSTAAIAIEAGLLLGLAFAARRSLWLPIGLHFGWNFTEGGIFGVQVSGHPAAGLFRIRLDGAALMTGGDFGPEASLPALIVCLGCSLLFAVAARRRRR